MALLSMSVGKLSGERVFLEAGQRDFQEKNGEKGTWPFSFFFLIFPVRCLDMDPKKVANELKCWSLFLPTSDEGS